jgi:hypothetical protein
LIAGYDVDLFWRSSVKFVLFAMEAKKAVAVEEYKQRAILAWNIAALSRAKRLPKIDSLFPKERKPPQTWQQQYDLMRQWHAAQERRKAMRAQYGR